MNDTPKDRARARLQDAIEADKVHTPGPWRALPPNADASVAVSADNGRIPCLVLFSPDKTRDANARLIAAAPDLLEAALEVEAAQQACGYDDPVSRLNDVLDALTVAIAKAMGR